MKTHKILIHFLFLVFILSACSAGSGTPTDEVAAIDAVYTAAVLTLSAQPAAATSTPTVRPPSSPTAQASLTREPTIGVSQYVSAPGAVVNTSNTCDSSSFLSDVTIPDGTILAPGESFTKTWLFQNTGTCTWSTSYSIALVSGSAMSSSTTALTSSVSSGGQINASVSMVAPSTNGTYTGYWKLANAAGTAFGQSVYVQIVVSDDAATITPTPTSTDDGDYTSTPTSTTAASTSTTAASTSTTSPTATTAPTAVPTAVPTAIPTEIPTEIPTDVPTEEAPAS